MKKENSIFVIAAVAALAVDLLFQQTAVYRISIGNTVLILALLVFADLAVWKRVATESGRYLLLSGNLLVVWLLFMVWSAGIVRQHYVEWGAYVGISTCAVGLVTAALFLILLYKGRRMTEDTILVLLMAALAIRIFYVVMTRAHIYQNDIGDLISPLGGHLGYVRYLLDNQALHDFDPTSRHQFYQPPLHYVITAVWVKIHTLFGIPIERADENIQVISLFYSVASLGVLNKIGLRLKLSSWGRFVGLSLAAFLPYDIMMSGAVNNDLLMTFLTLLCIYFTLKWYQESGLMNIMLMGITIGLAMMTKISAVLIAPGVAVIMLVKAWKERRQWKKYLGQFAVFGLAAFPLGLWYPLKSLIQYGMPLGYVPYMGDDASQFIGMYTGLRRFFEVGDQLTELCLHFDFTQPYIDYNIPISLVKYAVFGEGMYYLCNGTVYRLGTWMFWFVAAIFVIAAILCVVCLFRKHLPWIYKASLAAMILVMLGSYVKFCYLYPHVCTMHIRYIMVAVYLIFLAFGASLDRLPAGNPDGTRGRRIRGTVTVIVLAFALLSVLLNWNMEILIQ